MKNMWLLVSVALAGVALWLWKKPTPGAPTAERPLAAAPTRPLAETPKPAPTVAPTGALAETPKPALAGVPTGFSSLAEYTKYLATRGLMIAPTGEVVSIAQFKAEAATSPYGVPTRYMLTLTSGEQLLPTGDVRMPSGETKPMTESLNKASSTESMKSMYVKQLEVQLGHKLSEPKPHYGFRPGTVVVSRRPWAMEMVPGTLYVQPMAPTRVLGVFRPVYYYMYPVTRSVYVGLTPPKIEVTPPAPISR